MHRLYICTEAHSSPVVYMVATKYTSKMGGFMIYVVMLSKCIIISILTFVSGDRIQLIKDQGKIHGELLL